MHVNRVVPIVLQLRLNPMKTREGIYIWLSAFAFSSFMVLVLFATLPSQRFAKPDSDPVIEIDFTQWDKPMHAPKERIERLKSTPAKLRSVVRQPTHSENAINPPAEKMPTIPENQTPPVLNTASKLPEAPEILPQAAVTELIKDGKEGSEDIPVPTPIYQLTSMPRFAHKVEPQYPGAMRALGRESLVKLEVLIDANGKVRKVKVIGSGGDAFDNAARSALLASAFIPGNVEGKPVAVLMRIPIAFRFN